MEHLKITIAQINTHAGDIAYNQKMILHCIEQAKQDNNDVIIFPELALSGYGARDLWLRTEFLEELKAAITQISYHCINIVAIVGSVIQQKNQTFNVAYALSNGSIIALHKKCVLPKTELFEEHRYFNEGNQATVIQYGRYKIGLMLCEELWEAHQQHYPTCDIILCPSALPWTQQSQQIRDDILKQNALSHRVPIVFVNNLGYDQGLLLEGASSVFNKNGEKVIQLPAFEEQIFSFTVGEMNHLSPCTPFFGQGIETLYNAAAFSIKDFVRKNNFEKVFIHLDSDPNSILNLSLAVDSLGANNVYAILLKYPQMDDHLLIKLQQIATRLECECRIISTSDFLLHAQELLNNFNFPEQPLIHQTVFKKRFHHFLIRELASKENCYLLANINKTQLALGAYYLSDYLSALYSPLGDIYFSQVCALLTYKNAMINYLKDYDFMQYFKGYAPLLTPTQIQDYQMLFTHTNSSTVDSILERYIERNQSPDTIISAGIDPELTHKTITMLYQQQLKRILMPLAPKLSVRSFLHDWRMPLFYQYQAHDKPNTSVS